MKRWPTIAVFTAAAAITVGFSSTDQRRVIYVRNDSGLANAKIKQALPAFQKALDRDFNPAWDATARLVFIGHAQAPKGSWRISVVNVPNCMGCAGFHEWKPAGYARAEVSKDGGWQLSFTHELFEMLVDPVIAPDGTGARLIHSEGCDWLVEVGDPVEHDSYKINGVTISDFALEAWYSGSPGPYDFLGLVDAPHKLRPGGYAWKICGDWTELDQAI